MLVCIGFVVFAFTTHTPFYDVFTRPGVMKQTRDVCALLYTPHFLCQDYFRDFNLGRVVYFSAFVCREIDVNSICSANRRIPVRSTRWGKCRIRLAGLLQRPFILYGRHGALSKVGCFSIPCSCLCSYHMYVGLDHTCVQF